MTNKIMSRTELAMLVGMTMIAGVSLAGCAMSDVDDAGSDPLADEQADPARTDATVEEAPADVQIVDRDDAPVSTHFTYTAEKPADLPDQAEVQMAITTHSHSFRIVSDFGQNAWNSPSYITHSKAKTCIHLTTSNHYWWEYQLIWYDGGANKDMWTVNQLRQKGWYCSDYVSLPNRQNRVYTRLTDYGSFGSTIAGELYIYTN